MEDISIKELVFVGCSIYEKKTGSMDISEPQE